MPTTPGHDHQWLLTNGLGGFALGNESGMSTQRYHAMLIAALSPPVRRTIVLHSIIEQLIFENSEASLTTHEFGEQLVRHPDGWKWLARFTRMHDHAVAWTFDLPNAQVEKQLELRPGCNAATVSYTIRGKLPGLLRLRPMMPMRGFHSMAHDDQQAPQAEPASAGALIVRHGDIRVRVMARSAVAPATARIEPQWWRDIRYTRDRERGQDWSEDLWSPGVFEFDLSDVDAEAGVQCRLDVDVASPTLPAGPGRGATQRSESKAAHDDRLRAAASQFVVQRLTPDRAGYFESIIAGYPWFADWGRDAMISLPGLLMSTGETERAVSVLRAFAASMQDGLIPNCFDDAGGGAQYNSADASLWFVHAVSLVWSNVPASVGRELVQACRSIVGAYRRGTAFDIRMDDDGLITAGNEHVQITWMDAARDGVVFTPRHGKAVEINALWYNALRALSAMSDAEHERQELSKLADRVGKAIAVQFWWPKHRCLHDVLSPTHDGRYAPDGRIRPNQIFAVSLPHSPLSIDQQRDVVQLVEDRLLTPFGLRTLDRDDPAYRGRFEGDLFARDSAYHQGTVWPWLIGPFCEALLRVNRFSEKAKARVQAIIAPLLGELDRGCIGQIAEVYDGDEPQRAAGCCAQAWSIAELLRVQAMLRGDGHASIRAVNNQPVQAGAGDMSG